MGIHALGFLTVEDYKNNSTAFLSKFREDLFQLGAFGFDPWVCRINSFNDSSIRLLSFNDEQEKSIAIYEQCILVGDANLPLILKGLNLVKRPIMFKVDGSMAQLGDFKIRYGEAFFKDKPYGILFDIEYLPVSRLSVDFRPIFESICSMMNLELQLIVPQLTPDTEYSFSILAQDYLKLLDTYRVPTM